MYGDDYNDKEERMMMMKMLMMMMMKPVVCLFQVVMDNCVEESDHRKDDIEYSVSYHSN